MQMEMDDNDGLDSMSGQAEIDENAEPLGQQFNYIQKQNENVNEENVYAVGGGFQAKQIQNNM